MCGRRTSMASCPLCEVGSPRAVVLKALGKYQDTSRWGFWGKGCEDFPFTADLLAN